MKAFPYEEWVNSTDPKIVNPIRHPGMDLRDYFAAHALTGLLTEANSDYTDGAIADLAYNLANAMMEARNVNTG